MTSYTVTIRDSGENLQTVTSVEFEQVFENQSSIADVTVYDFDEVKNKIETDEIVEIKNEQDEVEFVGQVKTISDKNGETKIKIEEKTTELLDFDTNGRIFYNTDSGQAIQSLIEEDINSRGSRVKFNGSSLDRTDSNAPVYELAGFTEIRPETYGTDLIFLGFEPETTDETNYYLDIENVEPKGDQFTFLELQLILNNISGVFSLNAQYIDSEQNNYVWSLGSPDGVVQKQLRIENAVDRDITGMMDVDSTNENKLRLIIRVNGQLAEPRAIGVDGLITTSVDIIDRPNKFNDVDIPNSGRKITRKFTNSVGDAVQKILEEEDRKIIVDENNNITTKDKNENTAELEITEDKPIVNFETVTENDNIRNRIVVEGANDIYVTEKSSQSINTFGFTRTLKKRDLSIKNEEDAVAKARQLLSEYAFRDTEIIVEMPETEEVRNTEVGDEITVNYSDINNEFTVKEISKTDSGWTKLIIDAESARF